ncbi:hypothetical protein E2C01_057206 [Portunus trituberculatus]|uniref:Uncharacterized protein n=1 Tax=Portunus trituberculatus TaxID=210409 RepID=A0A5B7GZE9_PORTR|nr:hypothetical protein [Portunus trituberculatus]
MARAVILASVRGGPPTAGGTSVRTPTMFTINPEPLGGGGPRLGSGGGDGQQWRWCGLVVSYTGSLAAPCPCPSRRLARSGAVHMPALTHHHAPSHCTRVVSHLTLHSPLSCPPTHLALSGRAGVPPPPVAGTTLALPRRATTQHWSQAAVSSGQHPLEASPNTAKANPTPTHRT